MPLQNRVQPDGSIIAHPARGAFMGNRGILHDDQQTLGRQRWRHKAWVTCLLRFKGRKRALMTPNKYTELFFLDEAVAFAAGHRPCGECRRAAFNRFREAAGVTGKISDYDQCLHAARAIPRTYGQVRHEDDIRNLPDGVFILDQDGCPHLIHDAALVRYKTMSYGAITRKPATGRVTVLTPEPLVQAIRAGYKVGTALTL